MAVKTYVKADSSKSKVSWSYPILLDFFLQGILTLIVDDQTIATFYPANIHLYLSILVCP